MLWYLLSRIRAEEAGEVAISYSLVAALVSIAAIIAMSELGDTIPLIYHYVTDTMIEGLARIGW